MDTIKHTGSDTANLKDNKYLSALFQVFSIFIQEESLGRVFTEYRFKDAVEKARRDYPEDKEAMIGLVEPRDIELSFIDKATM